MSLPAWSLSIFPAQSRNQICTGKQKVAKPHTGTQMLTGKALPSLSQHKSELPSSRVATEHAQSRAQS